MPTMRRGTCASDVRFAPSHFTGKERDSESGNDYFGVRYYGSSMGRFMTPDPTGGSLLNPQTLNKYTYGLNNPLANTDPTGLDCIHINNDTGQFQSFESGDCNNSTPDLANTGQYVNGTVNQIQLNQQGQVLGYNGTNDSGSSIGESFMSPENGTEVFNLNPYAASLSSSAFGQTVNVFGNSSSGLDTNLVGISAQIPSNGLQQLSNMAEIRALPQIHLTLGQIVSLCQVASALSAGGTVPGAVAPSPTEDTLDQNMLVPSERAQYPGETRPMEVRSMTPSNAVGNNAANAAAMFGTWADCVRAATAANH